LKRHPSFKNNKGSKARRFSKRDPFSPRSRNPFSRNEDFYLTQANFLSHEEKTKQTLKIYKTKNSLLLLKNLTKNKKGNKSASNFNKPQNSSPEKHVPPQYSKEEVANDFMTYNKQKQTVHS
jgi:hypothetical protein